MDRAVGRDEDARRPGATSVSTIEADGRAWERVIICTHWIEPGEDLLTVLSAYVVAHVRAGDCIIVSEKAVVIATEGGIPVAAVKPGRLARTLARSVRPVGNSRGLSIPEKMQLVITRAGRARILAATVAATITRPLGIKGAFYLVAGREAKGMDGMRPPMEDYLLPPLDPREAGLLCARFERELGVAVAIVDVNDRAASRGEPGPGPWPAARAPGPAG